MKVKAREIKQNMLEAYQNLINAYEFDKQHIEERRNRIRIVEQDLEKYFGLKKYYEFE